MLIARPGVFVAGEMLDWEAPTGGYLLQACFSTGRAAAAGVCAGSAAERHRHAVHGAAPDDAMDVDVGQNRQPGVTWFDPPHV